MQELYENTLKDELAKLSRQRQLAFALLMLERMIPLLLAFSKKARHDSTVHLKAVATIWNLLNEKKKESKLTTWRSLRAKCLKGAPDTEDYSDESVSYALNTALSIVAILDFLIDRRTQHIVEIAEFARASVDMYLESTDTSIVSEPNTQRLDAHPLMLREREQEKNDLEFLLGLALDPNASVLKKRAKTQPPLLPVAFKTSRA